MGFFRSLLKMAGKEVINQIYSQDWFSTKSDEDLSNLYESKRQEWLKSAYDIEKAEALREEMYTIDHEMVRRSNEKYAREHPDDGKPHRRWTDANRWEKD